MGETLECHAAERYARIGEGEEREDAKGDPRVQRMLQGQQRRGLRIFGSQRDAESQYHTGQCRVHAALEYADPEQQSDNQIRSELDHPQSVHRDQGDDGQRCQHQRQARHFARVEQRDHDDRPQVVDDRQGHQEQLERYRHPFAEQRQHAQGESDVGGHRDCPPAER